MIARRASALFEVNVFDLHRRSPRQRVALCDVASQERVTIILPVLNEAQRIVPCLTGLIMQPSEAQEILVVDGGSTDGTQELVESFRRRDDRISLIAASSGDEPWTGKAWSLQRALERSREDSGWILCVDADVRVSAHLIRSLLAHAQKTGVTNFSLATAQHLSGPIDALLHPAMLTTLIYRFGVPGTATKNLHRVQANGQCFLSRRETLLGTGAVRAALRSLCEDITIARRLAECGEAVGFYESEGLVDVAMYADWRETWVNWPRSLPMRDQYFGWRETGGLAAILLFQALPLPLLILGIIVAAPVSLLLCAGLLVMIRVGMLVGMARAYPNRPWTYWLSPLCDLPVAVRIIQSALTRRHRWRGRSYVRRKDGTFEPA